MGMWQMIPGANVSRLLARTGADWVCVDCEHGNIDGIAAHIQDISLTKADGWSRWSYARCCSCHCRAGSLAHCENPGYAGLDGQA